MAAVQIRVGAVVDASFSSLVPTIASVMAKARAKVEAESGAMGRAMATSAQRGATAQAKEADRAAAAAKRAYDQISREADRAASAEVRAAERAAQQRERAAMKEFDARLRASARAAAEEEKDILRVAAAAERAAAQQAKAAGRDRVGVARDAARTLGGVVGAAGRLGLDVAKGAGVQLDVGALVGKSVSLEKTATDLVNSFAAAKGRQAAPGEATGVAEGIRRTALVTGTDTGQLAEGLQEIVARSSDLDTGMKSLQGLAEIARATGSNVKELAAAAGDVNSQLAEGPDKAERLLGVMRALAKQGALGAVEIRDLAKYAARLSGNAALFAGGYEGNIASLGMLAQLARHGGGAATPAEATNAAAAFARDLTKPTTLKKWQAAGIKVFDKEGNIQDPQKLIQAALYRTGGDQAKLAALMPNVVMQRGVKELAKVYRDAENQKKGTGAGAVQARMAEFTTAMSKEDIAAAFKTSMQTSEAKVAQFNAQLERIVSTTADRLLPQMEKLAPAALKMVEAFSGIVSWASENPGMAITAAIVGSIAKAALGSAIASALQSVISGGVGGLAGRLGGVTAGGAGAIGGAAVAGAAIGAGTVAYAQEKTDEIITRAGEKQEEVQAILARARAGKAGTTGQAASDATANEIAIQQQAAIVTALNEKVRNVEASAGFAGFFGRMTGAVTGEQYKEGRAGQEALPQLKAVQEAQLAALRAMAAATLKVHVTNMPNAPGGVDNSGRTSGAPLE